jgi:hypothetical protein
MKPNAAMHKPSPDYLRGLLDQIQDQALLTKGKVSQRKVAARIGVSERQFRGYLQYPPVTEAPYLVQYALEQLCYEMPDALVI